jgi:7-cyano-7-deazaguanine synthase
MAAEQGYQLHVLTFDYGQRNRYEISAAEKLAAGYGVSAHMRMKLDLRQIGGSALTDNIDVPGYEEEGIPVTYVPGRNLIFLSIAVSWAEVIGAEAIFIGANVRDYSGYPDCRLNFLKSFQRTADLATRKTTNIVIKAPLINMSKARIVDEGRRLGIDFTATSSCYDPLEEGRECGVCSSCRIRAKGFEGADPAERKDLT